MLQKTISLLLSLVLALSLIPPVSANETSPEAQQIPSASLVTDMAGLTDCGRLFDGDTTNPVILPERTRLTLEYPEGIGSIYILFNMEYGPCTITDNSTGRTYWFGKDSFLHAFWDLEDAFGTAPTSIDLRLSNGSAEILEMYVFTSGQTPDFVQKWSAPKEGATDLILFSAHGDDEQLFFAGLLPYYAGELDYEVLVVYLTGHLNQTSVRRHEMLNGLWAVGVDTYPVFGPFGDYYTTDLYDAYHAHAQRGQTKQMLQEFVIEQIRRYKPLVTVGHDLRGGEYGHGQHMMYADLLCFAVENANDPAQFPVSAERWGTWDVPKTYLHLWKENQIFMDWDQPLSRFDGMTAYQVTKYLGFPQHESQYNGFWWYLNGNERSDEFSYLSPSRYGLYRSTVGLDEVKQDMFENLVPYALRKPDSLS